MCACARLLLMLGAASLASFSMAAIYYLSPNGSDAKDGLSLATAWKTLARVNSATLLPGDTVLLESSKTFSGTLVLTTPGITVTTTGALKAGINAGSGWGITATNVGQISISNLTIRGGWNANTQTGNGGAGIEILCKLAGAVKLKDIAIDKVDVYGFRNGGILIGSSPPDSSKSGYTNVRITACKAHDNGDVGIMTYGPFSATASTYAHQEVYVGACHTYQNRGIANKGSHSGSGIIISDCQVGVIEQCSSHDNGTYSNYSGGGPVGIWTWDSDRIAIQCNESYNNQSQTGDGGGFDLDGGVTNSVMQYNYSHGNAGPGYLVAQFAGARPLRNLTIRYNISQNDGRNGNAAGILLWDGWDGVANVGVYHNSIYMTPTSSGTSAGIALISPTRNVQIRNNVIITTLGVPLLTAVSGQQGTVIQGNCYWSSGGTFDIVWQGVHHSSLDSLRATTGLEKLSGRPTGLNLNPDLVSVEAGNTIGYLGDLSSLTSFRVKPSSPILGQGINLKRFLGVDPGARDFWGTSLPESGAVTIGACQAVPGQRHDGLIGPFKMPRKLAEY